jgi:DNA-binding MarR family transcriptional regulator
MSNEIEIGGATVSDRVDKVIHEWSRRRADLDPVAIGVVARVLRASHHLQAALDDVAAAYGLSHQGDLEALAELYRADAERGLTPTELASAGLLTAGGMTARLHRLERAGLIKRHPNPDDGRGVLVRLTPAGVDVVEHALPVLFDAQAHSIRGLTPSEHGQLADLLRVILEGFGDVSTSRPSYPLAGGSG